MNTAIKSELEAIKQAILHTLPVSEIYLFGSYASGAPNKDSDFDIYVVIPDGSMRPIIAMQEITRAISGEMKRPVDILVGYESVFNKRRELQTIERTIGREGVRLYGQGQLSQTMV